MNKETAIFNLKETLSHTPSISFFEDRAGHPGNHRIEVRGNNQTRFSINYVTTAILLSMVYRSKKSNLHYQDFLFLNHKEFNDIFTKIEDKTGEPIWPEWWGWMECEMARVNNEWNNSN